MQETEELQAVQRMQDYIEDHLHQPITLKDLAGAAGYSPWHAARLFREETGRAPFEYLRARRLTKAALTLRDGRGKVIDVALDFVFGSHEGFTRAFSSAFGVAPKRYSIEVPPIQLFLPEKVYDVYRGNLLGGKKVSENNGSKTVFVQVVERQGRKALIKRGRKAGEYFAYCEEVGCDVWAVLCSVKEALYEPVGMWLPDSLVAPGTSPYVQGVEVPLDYANQVPEGFDLIDLAPCKLMIFQGEPYSDEAFMQAIDDLCGHIDRFDPEIYGYRWAPQGAPRMQLQPEGYRGYIEARPVEALGTAK